jgi:alpha-1,6-mannosyltransferase
VHDRAELARAYAGASCLALPGAHETFGLAALEAAACGASVVTADSTPSAQLIPGAVETFRAGDAPDLLRAIERARRRPRDVCAASALRARHGWDAALSAELADLKAFLGKS